MNKRIYLSSPHMSNEGYEKKYIKESFDSNWIAPAGPNLENFEKEICQKVGINYSVALSSGTAAIHMALKASGIKEGDIVICQSFTFSATANPIIYEKAIPVFIDSDFETWNINPKNLEEALIKYPDAKALIIVHLYGLTCNMDEIMKLCKKHNVILIEDAAESLGSTYKGKHTGTFGDYGVFSFNGNKIITTSGGGILVSNNQERIEKVRFWSTQSRDKALHYQHSELGYNYRMSNISAGIGRGQLKVLNQRIEKRNQIFNYYKKNLGKNRNIEFMPINNWNKPNCWLSCMILKNNLKPEKLIRTLEKHNIESRPLWKPMHLQPFFKNFDYIGGRVSETLFEKGICLPSDSKLSNNELKRIVKIIKDFLKNEKK
jgi:dTDP-4-amino-4,6-dideoxygalactose transaminase